MDMQSFFTGTRTSGCNAILCFKPYLSLDILIGRSFLWAAECDVGTRLPYAEKRWSIWFWFFIAIRHRIWIENKKWIRGKIIMHFFGYPLDYVFFRSKNNVFSLWLNCDWNFRCSRVLENNNQTIWWMNVSSSWTLKTSVHQNRHLKMAYNPFKLDHRLLIKIPNAQNLDDRVHHFS